MNSAESTRAVDRKFAPGFAAFSAIDPDFVNCAVIQLARSVRTGSNSRNRDS